MPDSALVPYESLFSGQAGVVPLQSVALRAVEPAAIPPRPWAYGQFLMFGTGAVLGAVDGGGKGAISIGIMLSMITGRPLLGEHVWRTGPVAIVSYEDDETEWHRRIAAACVHHGLDYAAVAPYFHFLQRPEGRISFAAQAELGLVFPDGNEIVDRIKAIGAVLLLIDPFNHASEIDDGNNNVMVAKVAGEISRIARESGAAALVLHHLRKGSTGAADDLMGATSLRATFRSCRILARMTPAEAEKMSIADPWRYIRIAGSKENYAPPPEKSSWFRLASVPLGNATPAYPNGDDIGVATIWQARPMFQGMDGRTLAAVFAALRKTIHSPAKQAKNAPWAGQPLIDLGGRTQQEATGIVKGWLETGVLVKGTHYDPESKHQVGKIDLDEAKIAAILSEFSSFDAFPVE